MSKRNKLEKFAELLNFPNVYQNYDVKNPGLHGVDGIMPNLKGKWAKDHFKNDHPITLELACGKGAYTRNLSKLYPDQNFIGVDIKGARIWKGAKIALDEGINNAAFFRTRIEQLAVFFEPGEVSDIWITFPDPFLRNSKSNRRLTSSYFLKVYRKLLKPSGKIHLKTDEPLLYDFTLATLAEEKDVQLHYSDNDIYSKALPIPELEIKTYYEKKHLAVGKKITYIQFSLLDTEAK